MRPRTKWLAGLTALGLAFIAVEETRAAKSHELLLTTENYPPFNMQDDGTRRIVGISTDLVREIMKRAKVRYRMQFLPWQRAYAKALQGADTCVFSTTETDERLPKFKWVGPLVRNDWIFFGRSDSAIEIGSLEEARQHTVGGYKGDAVALFLEEQGFDLDLASHDHLNPDKLAAGRFDLWATGNHLGPFLARQAGVEIRPLFTFRETVMSLACNAAIDDALIATLNDTLEDLRAEGAIDKIVARYQ